MLKFINQVVNNIVVTQKKPKTSVFDLGGVIFSI